MNPLNFKHILSLAMLVPLGVFAQQPFESIGKEDKVLTLSNGQFQEVPDASNLVKVGSVMLDRTTGSIAYFVEFDTAYSEATLEPEVTSRWWSRDPAAAKYPYSSPYVAFGNNPVIFTDPGGDTLRLFNKNLYDRFKTIVSVAFDDKVKAQVAEDGTVTFHHVEGTELNSFQQATLDGLLFVQGSEFIAKGILIDKNDERSKRTLGDDFYKSILDLDDLAAFGNNDDLLTTKAILAHFAIEQLDKAEQITEGLPGTDYERAHEWVLNSFEDRMTRLQRYNITDAQKREVSGPTGQNTYFSYWVDFLHDDGSTTRVRYNSFYKNGQLSGQSIETEAQYNERVKSGGRPKFESE